MAPDQPASNRKPESALYPDNRHGRRQYAAELRRRQKRGPKLTPPKRRKK